MPQHLTDLGQRNAGAHQRARSRVPQLVRMHPHQPGAGTGSGHHLAHSCCGQGHVWGLDPDEHRTACGGGRSAIAEVAGDRGADIIG